MSIMLESIVAKRVDSATELVNGFGLDAGIQEHIQIQSLGFE